jgi:hypothetical protein
MVTLREGQPPLYSYIDGVELRTENHAPFLDGNFGLATTIISGQRGYSPNRCSPERLDRQAVLARASWRWPGNMAGSIMQRQPWVTPACQHCKMRLRLIAKLDLCREEERAPALRL